MKRIDLPAGLIFTAMFAFGCTPGANSRLQPVTQGGHVAAGKLVNVSSNRDALTGDNASVNNVTNNYYQGLSKEDLQKELISRDKQLAELTGKVLELGPTRFSASEPQRKQLENGKWKTSFVLVPHGKQVVPILTVAAAATNGAKVEEVSFFPKGGGGMMSSSGRSQDGHSAHSKAQSLPPVEFVVNIISDVDPGLLQILIDPLYEGGT